MTDRHVGTGQTYSTIQSAVNAAVAGDNILIHSGTYVERVLIQNKQGTADNWITIQPYQNDTVIVDGQPTGSYDGVFFIRGTSTTRCHYIHITRLEIRNSNYAGVFAYGDAQADVTNIHVDYCHINDCGSSGIYAYHNTSVEADHNNIHNVNNTPVSGYTYAAQEGISFSGVYGFEIHHNVFSNGGKECIDTKSGSRNGSVHHNDIDVSQGSSLVWDHIGIYCDAFSLHNYNIDIYNNYVHGDHGQGIVLGIERDGGILNDINVFNNVVDVSWASAPGLCLVTYWYNGQQPSNRQEYNIHFYNNTVKTYSHNPMYISTDYGFLISNIVWENNIFVSDTAYYLLYNRHYPSTTPTSILLIRNNLFYRYNGAAHNQWSDGYNLSWGQNAIVDQNPLLTNGLHLQSNSPAINTGVTVDLDFDYDDNPRPIGSYDIGAYEYSTYHPPGQIDDTKSFTVNVQ